jgi:hypothetical protein
MTAEQFHRATEDFDAVRTAVSALHLSRWTEVEPRLRVRAKVGIAPTGEDLAEVGLEVVLPVRDDAAIGPHATDRPAGMIPLWRLPWQRWSVSQRQIWLAAAKNTRRETRPTVTALAVPPFQAWLLTGDGNTSGVALDVGYFIRAGARSSGRTCTEGTGWFSVLSDSAAVLLLISSTQQGRVEDTLGSIKNLRGEAITLIAELRRRTDRQLPQNLACYRHIGTGAHPQIA